MPETTMVSVTGPPSLNYFLFLVGNGMTSIGPKVRRPLGISLVHLVWSLGKVTPCSYNFVNSWIRVLSNQLRGLESLTLIFI